MSMRDANSLFCTQINLQHVQNACLLHVTMPIIVHATGQWTGRMSIVRCLMLL